MMLLLLLLLLVGISVGNSAASYACDHSNATLREFPFCNASLPTSDRVRDFIDRLTIEEKILLLGASTPGVPRLGMPSYEWWNEGLHGVSWSPGMHFGGALPAATSFPMPNTVAASFNSTLFYRMGQVVSTEARAFHNLGQGGLTYWSPNVNIYRDPRWGRGQETPGEDPFLSSSYASNYVKGLQDDNDENDNLKVSACCKHMTAYDIDNSTGAVRYDFDALVTKQDLQDTYNVPFQGCVEDGHVSCIMCAYNRLNGVPVCADRGLLTDTVRKSWNLNGYITTDSDSIQSFYVYTNYAASPEEAAADALLAGVNLNSGLFLRNYTLSAIQQNRLPESVVDQAVGETTKVLMRLGFFDGDPTASPLYGSIGPADVCSQEHIDLALEASRQGIVLLKNLDNVLPLSNGIRSLAVVGPHANATLVMTGNYAGLPCRYTSPLEGLSKYTNVVYAQGCDVACKSDESFSAAMDAAANADAVVMVLGINLAQEAESQDRTSLRLPGKQQELVSRLIQAAKGPIILVILSGGSIDVSFAMQDSKVAGIIWAGYPGQDGGAAIAEVIFGDYNPGGRLPTSWYPESYVSINITNMNMRPDPTTGYPGRTYRFYTGPSIFEFGFGLSYTNVSAEFVQVPELLEFGTTVCTGLNSKQHNSYVKVVVKVHNEGSMDASHAVLLFWVPENAGQDGMPRKELIGFKRIWIGPDSSLLTTFKIQPCKHLSRVTRNGTRVIHTGMHTLLVGDARHFVRVKAFSSSI